DAGRAGGRGGFARRPGGEVRRLRPARARDRGGKGGVVRREGGGAASDHSTAAPGPGDQPAGNRRGAGPAGADRGLAARPGEPAPRVKGLTRNRISKGTIERWTSTDSRKK